MLTTLRRSLRALARTPGFTLIAILSLALALGAIGTVFAVVNSVLLEPLPYPGSERIIRIVRNQGSCTDCPISRPALAEWQAQSGEAFEAVGAFVFETATLTGEGEPEKLQAYRVTPEFWAVMGVPALLGRPFDANEDRAARDVVVISSALWQRRFGGDPAVLGRKLVLNGEPHDIVGVMPDHFRYPETELWLPAQLATSTTDRGTAYLNVVGRLREGVALEQAERVLATITARQAQEHPTEHAGLGARLVPLQVRVTSAVRPALNIVFAASAIVVLIACANLANLMLARAQSRRRELAVRGALGASRGRIVRLLLGEASVIAVAGAVLGAAIASAAVSILPTLAPNLLPNYNPLEVDARSFAFVAAVALVALFGFGLWPAWRNAGADPAVALHDEARGGTSGRGRSRARAVLVVAEVALSFVLLAGAGLLVESLRRIGQVDPTVDVARLAVASVSLPQTPSLPGEAADAWFERHAAATIPRVDALLERVRALPGVESAAFTDAVPLSGRGNTNSTVRLAGRSYTDEEAMRLPLTEWRFVSSDYFATVGLALQRGRGFGPDEGRASGPVTDVLVNDAFVDTFLDGVEPVGQQLSFRDDVPKTIVGVVESARQWGLAQPPSPEVYMPIHDAFTSDLELVVASANPAALVEPLRRAIREVAPDAPVTAVRTMTEIVEGGESLRRFFATLMLAFSAIALVLAMVGLYGVLAYSVAQRRSEIGVRMSLGASARDVLGLVLRQGLVLVGVGVVAGLAGALALARALASLLFGVAAHDPGVLLAVAAALVATAAVACAVPAWRAARIAPTEALRHA